jgi:hypothetical protein
MGTCAKIRWAVYNRPSLLKSILADRHLNRTLTTTMLHNLLPRRSSIEIECLGKLGEQKNAEHYKRHNKKELSKLSNKYKVHSISFDYSFLHDKTDYCEHRISITGYRQLEGLFKVLEDMKRDCILNGQSGCHIHIDLNPTLKRFKPYYESCFYPSLLYQELQIFMNKKLRDKTIYNILGIYAGQYPPTCQIGDKCSQINIRTDYKSIEFRTAPMTFDYFLIITWFIKLNKLLNEFENCLDSTLPKGKS